MIKPFMAAGIVAACFTTPAFAQSDPDGPHKARRTNHQPMASGRTVMGPSPQAARYGMGPGAQVARPAVRPFAGPQMVRTGGYGTPYGYGRRGVGTGYGYGDTTGYGSNASYGYAGSDGRGYATGYGAGYGYDRTIAVPRQVGYDVGTTSGLVGYAAAGASGYAAQPCCGAPSNAVATTAYVPVLTYRPIRVMYTPQVPPYYNTPPYVAY